VPVPAPVTPTLGPCQCDSRPGPSPSPSPARDRQPPGSQWLLARRSRRRTIIRLEQSIIIAALHLHRLLDLVVARRRAGPWSGRRVQGMREKFTKISILVSVFFVLGARLTRAESKSTELSNEHVKRVIDLTSHVVRHTISITISNPGPTAHTYQMALPGSMFDRLASINAFDNAGKELDVFQRTKVQHEK
jgi:hypothetical protein